MRAARGVHLPGPPPRLRRAAALGVAVLGTGVLAGLGGAVLVLLLRVVQHAAYGYLAGSFAAGVEQATAARRVLAMGVGGAVVGLGWWALRRRGARPVDVPAALADGRRLPVPSTSLDAVLQVVAVGFGASLGREGAPRQVGAALAGWLARRVGTTPAQQRTLIACGAGAGLAAVYDVPLSGVLFTSEVLLASVALADVVPAVLASAVATVVAWPVTGGHPVYQVPAFGPLRAGLVVGALLLGPLAGLVGVAFVRLTGWARGSTPAGWRLPVVTTAVFAVVGAVAVVRPEVLGNGRGPAELAFTGAAGASLAASLLLLKPLATAACLRSGAAGGLLTPALATGAVLGTLAGNLWALAWPGAAPGAFAVVAAAAVLSATLRAPIVAVALVAELTGGARSLLVPMLLAVAGATLVARRAGRGTGGRTTADDASERGSAQRADR